MRLNPILTLVVLWMIPIGDSRSRKKDFHETLEHGKYFKTRQVYQPEMHVQKRHRHKHGETFKETNERTNENGFYLKNYGSNSFSNFYYNSDRNNFFGLNVRDLISEVPWPKTEETEIPWPIKKEAVVEGDLILGGLMMVHEREDSVTCGPVMPQGGVQALETMLYTLDVVNNSTLLPNIMLGAHILDDCDKDTYGLEMAVDFIKGKFCISVMP